jgi:hypothetical protein
MDDEVYVLTPKARRFKCVLSAAEMDQMLARRISWGGLGMYGTMCEYEPDILFTVESLGELASNPPDEVEAILDELIHAGYVFRTDARVEGKPAYAVNRDMLPESITEVT